MPEPLREELRRQFGDIDIYLFDQLLKGRIVRGMPILDAGCGEGRNLHYLLRTGGDVWGVDRSAEAIEKVRRLAKELAPALPADRFSVQTLEHLSFDDGEFDCVISSAVLHFARSEGHWWEMVQEMWRVLGSGGFLFARLASTIGHETRVRPLGGRLFVQPDGSERFLVDEAFLVDATKRLGGVLLDPIKTTVVQDARSMTTWVLRRR